MTIKSSFGAVHLDVNPGAAPSAVLDPETPFRVLLLGDFSGRALKRRNRRRGGSPWRSIATISTKCWHGCAPSFSGMRFAELDDFHPDRIYQEQVSKACAKCAGGWRRLRLSPRPPPKSAPGTGTLTPPPACEGSGSGRNRAAQLTPGINLLDSIVEAAEPAPPQAPIRRGELRSFVDSVVKPYSVPAEDPELPRLLGLS